MKTNPLYKSALAQWTKKPGRQAFIGSTDTAKLIRATLKAKFPNTKFSVRTDKYAGGSSIRVRWTDGPTSKLVDAVIGAFAGSGFDGMTDYKYSVGARLMPDGTAETRSVEAHYGTEGDTIEASKDGAIPVSFCADFVFTEREYSKAALERTAQAYAAKYVDELSEAILAGKLVIDDTEFWGARYQNANDFFSEPQRFTGHGGTVALMEMASRRMLPIAA
jgi:hypothetical protein